ncbi:MAG: glycosyl transferase [Bacteroidetes bacterium]|nr:glycosyl transferase [Bacteroidota bacterium]MCH8523423.1 hypothetical protein [Balneolales bacterium]
MNILYAIQGTGNGHFSRANEFIPKLRKHVNLDVLISGTNADVKLQYPVKYRFNGLSYAFGKSGGIDYWQSFKSLQIRQFLKDMNTLPIQQYDFIISDFEPISSWAAKKAGITCVGLSHQSAFLSKKTPRPSERSPFTEVLFTHYAPCDIPIGFHYKSYDEFIYTPVIRSDVRALKPSAGKHITVYLPAWSQEILIPVFQRFQSFQWHIFSKHTTANKAYKNVVVRPVDNQAYLKSMETAWGIVTGGGFEAPAEAMYLGKKLMIIPMRDQYEQKCNAEALKEFGVSIVPKISRKFYTQLEQWIDESQRAEVQFPDQTDYIIDRLLVKQDLSQQIATEDLFKQAV